MTHPKSKEEITHINYEEKMSLANAASFLETLAYKLKEEKSFTLTLSGKTHEVKPALFVELEVKLTEKDGKHELELEMEWTDDEDGQGLQIG